MKTLSVLEQKIAQLLALVKKLKNENSKILKEKAQLTEKLESLESSVLRENQNVERLSKEQELARVAVDSLIKNIEALVGEEQQS